MPVVDLTLVGLNNEQVSIRLGPGQTGEAAWSESKNTRFRARVLESVQGEAEIYGTAGGPPGAAIWAEGADAGGQPWIVYVTANGIGSYDGVHHDHTPGGWLTPRASQISLTSLNGLYVLNAPPNGPVHVVRGGGAATGLPGWPAATHCFTMTGYKYYLVAGGVYGPGGAFESLVMWSDAAEPGVLPQSWTPSPTNDAGDMAMADFPGPILAAHALSDAVVFYKFGGVFALAWVGGQAVMGRRVMFPKRGVVCGQGAVMLEREHVVTTAGDLIVHDGSQMRSLVEGRFGHYFLSRVQADMWEQVRMAHDVSRGEVWCAYPLAIGGPLLEALVWSVAQDTITVRELPASNDIFYAVLTGERRKWMDQTYAWLASGGRRWSDVSTGVDASGILVCLAGTAGSKFSQMDSSSASSSRVVYAQRVGIGVVPHQRRKLFKRLRPRIEGQAGSVISIQVGAHDEVTGPVTWDAAKNFTLGVDESVSCLAAGRFAAARFSGSGMWRIEGMQLEWDAMGQF